MYTAMLTLENDERQQPGATFGRMRNDGQRNGDMFGQDRNVDDEPHDRRAELHGRYVYASQHRKPLVKEPGKSS